MSPHQKIHAISRMLTGMYFGSLLIPLMVYIAMPAVQIPWRERYQIVFQIAIGMAVGSLLLSQWLHSQMMGRYSLEMRFKGIGFDGALSAFRTGALTNGFLCEFCAVLAALLYAITRDPKPTLVLMAFWAAHAVINYLRTRSSLEFLRAIADRSTLPAQVIPFREKK